MELRNNYKKLGDYIREIDVRNKELRVTRLLGVSNEKYFIPSIANIVGTDLSNYKIVKRNQFAFGTVTSRNGDKLSIAILKEDKCIVSSSYVVFEVIDESKLNPDYLMMWLRREEFDRYARFMSHGSVRELFGWDKLCDVELPIPDIGEQLKYVNDYESIQNAIKIKEAINNNLLEQCNVLFKEKIINQFKEQHNNGVWKSEELCDICTIKYGKGLSTEELLETGYPVYGGNGLIGYYSNFLYDDYKVIISCRGAASGKVQFSIPYSFVTSNSLVLNINKNQISFYYLLFMCQNIDFSIKVTGSAQPQLTVDNLNGIKIIIPDKQTYELVDNYLKKLFNSYVIYQKEIESLNKLQKILITKLAQQ